MSERWIQRFERAGFFGRVGLVGGGAVKLLASAIDSGLDRAATVTVAAKEAFEKELDPNVSDATILEEFDRTDEPG